MEVESVFLPVARGETPAAEPREEGLLALRQSVSHHETALGLGMSGVCLLSVVPRGTQRGEKGKQGSGLGSLALSRDGSSTGHV